VRLVVTSSETAVVPFLIVNTGSASAEAELQVSAEGCRVEPQTLRVSLNGNDWRPVTVRCALPADRDFATLVVRSGETAAAAAVRRGVDLSQLPWKRLYTPRETPPEGTLAAPDTDDTGWQDMRVPSLWLDTRYAWCRVHVPIPASWRGKKLRLIMGAVDDNDVTYLNGVEIGRTNGWDVRREYVLPQDHVRWGADNVVTVMVDNTHYGGGIHRGPVMIVAGEGPTEPPQPPAATKPSRPAQGRIGPALPLRPMHVQDGVLRYPDGAEVALWGVNIYPQSWYQFENIKRLGLDMKATVRQDLDHLREMGVQVIRMHIFDREITTGTGEILDNEHLDLLDYLVAECSRRGIYLFLTPIAWWGGPNENKESFSAQTSKPGMMCVPKAIEAAANYLRQFLSRKNRYSGRAYKDEPALCALEIMNEPDYFRYGDLEGSGYSPQGEPPEILKRDRQVFRERWQRWLQEHGFQADPALFSMFRYSLMRAYLRAMVSAIRSTGARQPVACSFVSADSDDITEAIADSEVDAVTYSLYPGGWEQVNDGRNLLYTTAPLRVHPRLWRKARLAYEFDAPATNTSCYMYPAIAANFRSGEVQIACQFQYDSIATARWNTDWNAHWLNWHYTPAKAVSFMIGGETFRSLPRGVEFDVGNWTAPAASLQVGPMWTSFAENNCAFAKEDRVLYARTIASSIPLRLPPAPSRIVGTGSSPYVEYGGTGAYVLERVSDTKMRLTINPDARLTGNSLLGSLATPVAMLETHRHLFRLKLPGWSRARCVPREGSPAPIGTQEGWLLLPGKYELIK